ncbi:MAG: hypothetical protein AAF676_08155 [Pseudomonadota bacterium]
MQDVTGSVLSYADIKRHIWNTYVLPCAGGIPGAAYFWEHFDVIDKHLFEMIVLERHIRLGAENYGVDPVEKLHVLAHSFNLGHQIETLTPAANGGGQIGMCENFTHKEIDLRYIHVTDYGNAGPMFCAKVLCRIYDCSKSEYVGLNCYVDTGSVLFMLEGATSDFPIGEAPPRAE